MTEPVLVPARQLSPGHTLRRDAATAAALCPRGCRLGTPSTDPRGRHRAPCSTPAPCRVSLGGVSSRPQGCPCAATATGSPDGSDASCFLWGSAYGRRGWWPGPPPLKPSLCPGRPAVSLGRGSLKPQVLAQDVALWLPVSPHHHWPASPHQRVSDYPHFADETDEAQRGDSTCSRTDIEGDRIHSFSRHNHCEHSCPGSNPRRSPPRVPVHPSDISAGWWNNAGADGGDPHPTADENGCAPSHRSEDRPERPRSHSLCRSH